MSSKTGPEPPPADSRRRPWSLAARLTAWYAGSSFLLILGTSIFLYWSMVSNLDREDDQFLANKVQILRAVLQDRPDDLGALRQEIEWQPTSRPQAAIFVRVLAADGRILLETPGMRDDLKPETFPPPAPPEAEPGAGAEVHVPAGRTYRVVAARAAVGKSGEATRIVQVAFDRTFEEAWLEDYRRNLGIGLVVLLLVCAGVGYQIAHRGLRPVARMAETAGRIRSSTLSERLATTGLPVELLTLACTFNEMLDRLEEAFQRLSRFSADIAHELRTPVNNLRGEAEVALGHSRSEEEYREALGSCLEECGRLTRLIDSLLFLARAENPEAELQRKRLDLVGELAGVRELFEAAAEERGVTLRVVTEGAIFADLDRTLLQRAVGNLLANALAHTPAGGTITMRALDEGNTVRVEVADTGEGIPPEHLPHVFDRFYRADAARTTASGRVGLGLAIVKGIAVLHGGTATVASEPGQGTRISLQFPRSGGGSPEAPQTKAARPGDFVNLPAR